MSDSSQLSEREQEILRLVATGASNKEIAQQLVISSNTVKVHLRNIFAKIGVASRTEAAIYAVNSGLTREAAAMVVAEAAEEATGELEVYGLSGVAALPDADLGRGEVPPAPAPRKLPGWQMAGVLGLVLLAVVLGVFLSRLPGLAGVQSTATPEASDAHRWEILAEMPTARFGLALAAYEDQIYALGGETGQAISPMVERYDLITNTWTRLSDKPTPVTDAAAAVIGGKIYIPGGRAASGELSDRLEIYDPRQDSWSQGAALPVALSGYALTAFEGHLFLFGGWDGTSYLATVYEYVPERDAWQAKTSMPTSRAFAGAALSSGKIYVIGGYDGKRALAAVEAYEPAKDYEGGSPWSKGAALPAGRYAMGVTSIADIIHVIGGIQKGYQAPFMLSYFPQTGQWEATGNWGLRPWSGMGVVALGTKVHILGGRLDDQPSVQNLSYQAIYTINIPFVR